MELQEIFNEKDLRKLLPKELRLTHYHPYKKNGDDERFEFEIRVGNGKYAMLLVEAKWSENIKIYLQYQYDLDFRSKTGVEICKKIKEKIANELKKENNFRIRILSELFKIEIFPY